MVCLHCSSCQGFLLVTHGKYCRYMFGVDFFSDIFSRLMLAEQFYIYIVGAISSNQSNNQWAGGRVSQTENLETSDSIISGCYMKNLHFIYFYVKESFASLHVYGKYGSEIIFCVLDTNACKCVMLEMFHCESCLKREGCFHN